MAIVTLGIDLAKNVFAQHGVDATGHACLVRPSVARAKLLELVASLPLCLIGIARESKPARQLMQLPGIGATTATAMVAMIGGRHEFRCGRQLSAWLGLVPGQYSSGGKQRLGHITKAGDPYLRMLLMLGARSVLQSAPKKSDAVSRWAVQLAARGLVEGHRGDRGEERAHLLGCAAARRDVQAACVNQERISSTA